jgi:uncharacterized membrane protein
VAPTPHRHIQHAGRELIAVVRGKTATHAYLRGRLLTIIWLTLAAAVISTLVVYFAERHAPHTQIHDLFDAFLFAVSQLLTASSVAAPQTDPIRVLELIFDIYAITVVAALAGSFGAFFHRRNQEHDEATKAAAGPATAQEPAG